MKAIVKYPARDPLETDRGPRINVVLLADGEEIKIWGDPGDAIAHFKKGQEVEIIKGTRGGWKLDELPGPVAQLDADRRAERLPGCGFDEATELMTQCLTWAYTFKASDRVTDDHRLSVGIELFRALVR